MPSVLCVCVSAVVAVFMCMCLLLHVSFNAYVSGCYSRSSSSSHTAIGGITQPFVSCNVNWQSVQTDMMHQVSLGANTMGMQLIAEEDDESDEDDEDEAGEMQGAEMMRVICKFRRLRRKHKALKHRFKRALKSAQYLKKHVHSVEEFQWRTKET